MVELATELAYEEAGTGGHTLLLVHGFPLTSKMWAPQIAALSSGWRVIAPDLPGFGRTPPGARSVDDYAAALHELLDRLGVDRAVVAGFSMGGYIAFAFQRRYAARVRGLILIDTKADADTDEGRNGRHAMAERARAEGKGVVIDAMLPRLVSDSTLSGRPDVVQQVLDVAAGATVDGIVNALEAMAARPSSVDDLPGIVAPALILVGKEDVITPPADAEKMADAIPDAKLVVIPDAGHTTPLEQPDAVNAAMREFLATV
jgi:pimeloyl-ACP methyl ester carboxylesterase